MTDEPHRIAAPVVPAPPQPYSFPVMATVAPVVVSLAIWFITKSAFALVFAALGPAVAIASLADARIQSRRRLRREESRFRSEVAAARSDIAHAHDLERAELADTVPSARRLVSGQWTEPERWLGRLDEPVVVGVGAGERRSTVTLEGAPVATRSRDPAHTQLRELVELAGRLPDAPLLVDARLGVAVVGSPVVAIAAVRALLVQVLASLPPATHVLEVETDDREQWRWLELVPHGLTVTAAAAPCTVIRVRAAVGAHPSERAVPARGRADGPPEIVLAVSESARELPTAARVVVSVRALRARIEQHPDRSLLGPVAPQLVSREEAVAVAADMAVHAARSRTADTVLPDRVEFDDCAPRDPRAEVRAGSLAAVVAVTARQPLALDLVLQGPHAVVGGTTGSGKSELLTAWILAIAHDHPPAAVNVLLVDFKGGSAFAALERLPHCVGMITDLDEAGAQRALESLAAELRRRERHLADAGAKSVDALPADARLARLVIVVDEFAAMVTGFPELHSVFADIAARGRSLGVHLVLCTQRPAGVIRDSVLANSALRLSLRVNNRADSSAVIGTDDAARLPLQPRGRAFVSTDGGEPTLAQFPLVTQRDIDRVAARWHVDPARPHRAYTPHRPWLDPLPTTVSLDAVRSRPHDGIPFGLLDDPANQSQPVAVYRGADHGNLLVVGGTGAGKTTVLATLAASARVHRVPGDVEGAWDSLVALSAETPGPGRPARLVLLDDLDALLDRFPEEYDAAVLELVTRCLREGPARDIRWVITAQRITPALHSAASLCGSRLLLRLPNRQEHVLAGGDGGDFVERLPPGAGRWQGLRVQVAQPTAMPAPPAGQPADPYAGQPADPPAGQPADPPAGQPADPPAGQRADLPAASPTSPPATTPATTPATVLTADRPLAVVSAAPADFAARLRTALPEFALPGAVVQLGGGSRELSGDDLAVTRPGPRAIVGDVDAWQAQWGALAAARPTHAVVVHGCSASEFRAVTRVRTLPPVLDGSRDGRFWLLRADGGVDRAVLPHQ